MEYIFQIKKSNIKIKVINTQNVDDINDKKIKIQNKHDKSMKD